MSEESAYYSSCYFSNSKNYPNDIAMREKKIWSLEN